MGDSTMGCGASSQPVEAPVAAVVPEKGLPVDRLIEYAAILAVHGHAMTRDLESEELDLVKALASKEISRVQKPDFTELVTFPAQKAQLAVAVGAIEHLRIETTLAMSRSGMRDKSPAANECLDEGIVAFRAEVVKRYGSYKLCIGPVVDKLFELVDRDNSGNLDQNEVSAAGKLMQKWCQVGEPGWDDAKNLKEMLEPAWILLCGSCEGKVSLHSVLKLLAIVLECLMTSTIALEEVWGLSIPKAIPKAAEAVFELFKASGYDLDASGTLGFDEALNYLDQTGLLAQLDEKLVEGKAKAKQLEDTLENTEMAEELAETAASRILDAASVQKLVPKLKEHLNSLKKASPSASSVLSTIGAGGITEEVFVNHLLKVTSEDAAAKKADISQHILDDIIIPTIKAQTFVKEESALKLVESATVAYKNLADSMGEENKGLVTSVGKAIFALLDLNGDGKISMSEINLLKKLNIKEEDLDAKELLKVCFTIMDRDGNGELDKNELQSLIKRLYKFLSKSVFGLQRYMSIWVVRILQDEGFANVMVETASIVAEMKGEEEMMDIARRLGEGITMAEGLAIYQQLKGRADCC